MIAIAGAPLIETERLTLRLPEAADFEAVAAYYATDRARFTGGPLARDRAWRAFGHIVGHWLLRGYGLFFFAPRGQRPALGMAGPWFPEGWPEPELAWILFSAEGEGQGYAREAVEAARVHARGLGLDRPVSYIHPENHRSAALAGRLGCVPEPDAPVPAESVAIAYRHPAGAA